jgi:hypothetical protein
MSKTVTVKSTRRVSINKDDYLAFAKTIVPVNMDVPGEDPSREQAPIGPFSDWLQEQLGFALDEKQVDGVTTGGHLNVSLTYPPRGTDGEYICDFMYDLYDGDPESAGTYALAMCFFDFPNPCLTVFRKIYSGPNNSTLRFKEITLYLNADQTAFEGEYEEEYEVSTEPAERFVVPAYNGTAT